MNTKLPALSLNDALTQYGTRVTVGITVSVGVGTTTTLLYTVPAGALFFMHNWELDTSWTGTTTTLETWFCVGNQADNNWIGHMPLGAGGSAGSPILNQRGETFPYMLRFVGGEKIRLVQTQSGGTNISTVIFTGIQIDSSLMPALIQ